MIPGSNVIKECKLSHLKETISMLNSKDIEIVCTKIEDYEHYELAKGLGFNLFQGYYFAKPKIIENIDQEKHIFQILIKLSIKNANSIKCQ